VTAKLSSLWPFRHAGLKALSLGLAVVLWMTVAGEETVERGLRVPLELVQFPPGLELQGETPTVVDVRVRGASTTLSRVGPGDIVAVLDLHTARPGRRLFQLTPEQVRAPFDVQIVQVAPATVAMEFENSKTAEVPITAGYEGIPAPGYVVGRITVDPTKVEITGPESSVKDASEAITEPVSVAGARAAVTENVTVGLLDPTLRLKSPRFATVKVEILPGPRERSLRLPVRLHNLDPNLVAQAMPTTVEIVLRGSRDALSHIEVGDVTAFVDLAGLGPGDYPMDVRVDAAADAGVARVDPNTVQVRITSAKDR
jgi:YbbR domain-containing protein